MISGSTRVLTGILLLNSDAQRQAGVSQERIGRMSIRGIVIVVVLVVIVLAAWGIQALTKRK